MTDAAQLGVSARRLRVAFVAIGALMSALLLGASLWSWAGAREQAEAVTAGQASMLQSGYMRFAGPGRRPPTPAVLEDAFAEDRKLGLLHVGVYSPGGLLFGAGEPSTQLSASDLHAIIEGHLTTIEVDARTVVRTAFPIHLRRPGAELPPELEAMISELAPPPGGPSA